MPSCSKADVVLVAYPFTELETRKVRPAIVVSSPGDRYQDVFIVPMTSRISELQPGEFILSNYRDYGLNVPTAVKRGCILIDSSLILKRVGTLNTSIMENVRRSLRLWLELTQRK